MPTKAKRTFEKQARQGDVLVERVAKLPKSAVEEPIDGARVILAHGEVTGHAHAVLAKACKMFRAEGERYLVVESPTPLHHEEHGPIIIGPGVYRVGLAREYAPGEIRRVAD